MLTFNYLMKWIADPDMKKLFSDTPFKWYKYIAFFKKCY